MIEDYKICSMILIMLSEAKDRALEIGAESLIERIELCELVISNHLND